MAKKDMFKKGRKTIARYSFVNPNSVQYKPFQDEKSPQDEEHKENTESVRILFNRFQAVFLREEKISEKKQDVLLEEIKNLGSQNQEVFKTFINDFIKEENKLASSDAKSVHKKINVDFLQRAYKPECLKNIEVPDTDKAESLFGSLVEHYTGRIFRKAVEENKSKKNENINYIDLISHRSINFSEAQYGINGDKGKHTFIDFLYQHFDADRLSWLLERLSVTNALKLISFELEHKFLDNKKVSKQNRDSLRSVMSDFVNKHPNKHGLNVFVEDNNFDEPEQESQVKILEELTDVFPHVIDDFKSGKLESKSAVHNPEHSSFLEASASADASQSNETHTPNIISRGVHDKEPDFVKGQDQYTSDEQSEISKTKTPVHYPNIVFKGVFNISVEPVSIVQAEKKEASELKNTNTPKKSPSTLTVPLSPSRPVIFSQGMIGDSPASFEVSVVSVGLSAVTQGHDSQVGSRKSPCTIVKK